MIFVWTGRGEWIMYSILLSGGVAVGLDQWLLAPGERIWPYSMAFALAGLFSVGLGLHARFSPARHVRNSATGCERFKRPNHSLYWIRAEYWGLCYLALAAFIQGMPPPGAAR